MAIDDNTKKFLADLSESGAKAFHEMSPEEGRAFMASLRPIYGEPASLTKVFDKDITYEYGQYSVRVLFPSENPVGVIAYCHGGGWVLMDIDDYMVLGSKIAKESNHIVVLINYRKAPENIYPAGVNDCIDAIQKIFDDSGFYQSTCPLPVTVMGDSAGGNLAAVSVNYLSKKYNIKNQVLIYPVVFDDLNNPNYSDPDKQFLLSDKDMQYFLNHYLPKGASKESSGFARTVDSVDDELTSPMRNVHSKIPRTLIITAENDILRNEGYEYYSALTDADVDAVYKCYSGQIHGFFTLLNMLDCSEIARKDVVEFLLK